LYKYLAKQTAYCSMALCHDILGASKAALAACIVA
jgi:hypothetical protein